MEKEPIGKEVEMPQELLLSQKVAKKAQKIAEQMKIEGESAEALRKYANMFLALREITADFMCTDIKEKTYAFNDDENGQKQEIKITRNNYSGWIKIWSTKILKLQNAYLDNSHAEITARKRILRFVQKQTPQNF